ncbi:MAG: heavy-metal-associated domain-containing protein [Dehalococcoidia bacterium]
METIVLTAPDISCDHCKHAIEKAVGEMPGVSGVNVAIEPKQVTVQYNPSAVTVEQIAAVMDEEGYPVAAG